jgi:hypothetical protein
MAQVVECLPSKHKAVSSNPSSSKKKKRKENQLCVFLKNSKFNGNEDSTSVFRSLTY